MMPLGTRLLFLAMFIWVTVAVGPWWLGLIFFVGATAVNYGVQRYPVKGIK